MAFATEETWRWQITDSPTWKRWHPDTDTKCTSTTTGSNVWKDLQKNNGCVLLECYKQDQGHPI